MSLAATGSLYALSHAAEPNATPDEAWRIMRVLPGVGHQRPHRWRDHRFAKHAPAGIGDKLDTKDFGLSDVTGLTGRFMHGPATGHNYRNVR